MKRALIALTLVAILLGCQKHPVAPAAPEKIYTMNGKLVSRDSAKNVVTIDNEDVPGVMSPMTMDYELRGMKPDALPPDGSKITSKLHEQNDKYWVTDIKPMK